MIPFIAEPILDTAGQTVALELLLRPAAGTPTQFLLELGAARGAVMQAALRTALRHLVTHHTLRGLQCPAVHINADSADLPSYARHLAFTVCSAGLRPEQITVELTEHTADHGNLESLHAQGFVLALDDIGREPFENLMDLPIFSTVKTDRCLLSTPDKLIHLARTHLDAGRHVIVEGIETAGDHALALATGAGATQGYYHYPPLHLSGSSLVKAAG